MNICVVTVNYKTADLLIESLKSVASEQKKLTSLRYVAVDNQSNDGSVEKITAFIGQSGYQEWASVIASDKNGGFSYGNNLAIRKALSSGNPPDYVMLLNPDTVIEPNAISALADFLAQNPKVGLVGSKISNPSGGEEVSLHHFSTLRDSLLEGAALGALDKLLSKNVYSEADLKTAKRCDWVSGSSMMVRREVFEKLGLLDEQYFLYFEEVDFFLRASRAGWETWFVPDSNVMHIEGAATGINSISSRPRYWYDSRRRFHVKNYGIFRLLMTDLLWLIGRLSYRLRVMLGLAKIRKGDYQNQIKDTIGGDLKALFSGDLFNIKHN